jgi:glycosyltransferase involved in cell wall biosynthesis
VVYVANIRFPTEKAHGFQIAKMCEAMARRGADVVLLHPRRRQPDPSLVGRDPFDFYRVERNFRVRELPNVDVLRAERFLPHRAIQAVAAVHSLAWGRYAARMARRLGADLFCTRDAFVGYWLTALGLPTLLEMHALPGSLQRRVVRRCFGRHSFRRLVTLTHPLRSTYEDVGAPRAKSVVLPDAVDLRQFDPLPDRATCRDRVGLPQDRLIVGYIGGFRMMGAGKGIPDLIRAFSGVAGSAAILLVCVGGPADAVPALRETARVCGLADGQVRLVNRVPNYEVPVWMRALDVATVPSPSLPHYRWCASPLKVFEYMAAGVPILATDLPAVREVLTHGRTAWLVRPDDPEHLRDGLDRLLRDPDLRATLAQEARRHVEAFTWDRRAERFLESVRPPGAGA